MIHDCPVVWSHSPSRHLQGLVISMASSVQMYCLCTFAGEVEIGEDSIIAGAIFLREGSKNEQTATKDSEEELGGWTGHCRVAERRSRAFHFSLDSRVAHRYLVYKRFLMLKHKDCIVFLLAKAYQKAHASLKRHLTSYGLTPIQCLIIEALRDEEGVSAGELGKKLVLDSATLSGVLDRLAEKGWIIKEIDSSDRRSLRIYLGEKAKEVAEPLSEQRERANEEIMSNLSMEEKVLLKRLLRDLT